MAGTEQDREWPVATPSELPGGAWLALLVATVAALAAPFALPWEFPERWTLSVESRLGDSVLVDVRKAESWGASGPFAQRLGPGDTLSFSAWRDQSLCLRVVDPERRRVVTLHIEPTSPISPARLVLEPPYADQPNPAPLRCDPVLAEDRVRVDWGRYFEPASPHVMRRERMIRRER